MRKSFTPTHARTTYGPTTRIAPTLSRGRSMPPAFSARELQLAPAVDGSVVVSSTEDGGKVTYAPMEDGSGVTITELLPDGSEGEVVTVQPVERDADGAGTAPSTVAGHPAIRIAE